MSQPCILFIIGPTASGKTSLALEEARRSGAAILSCDSLCVYKGMDIGTAKPTAEEQAQAPHYGIDLSPPGEQYSVAHYIEYRDSVLHKLRQSDTPVIVAGGSGFYLKSFFTAVTDTVTIPPEVETRVEGIFREEGLPGLVSFLKSLHGEAEVFPGLDLQNPRRVQKAAARCLASGRSYSELLEAFRTMPEPLPDFKKEVWLISRGEDDLHDRIQRRTTAMLKNGLIDEVRRLREEGFERNPSAAGAIGYREVLAHLDDSGTEADLQAEIVTHTNQLVRKQRTWFRHNIQVDREVSLD